jgi:hypothetical protein
MGMMSLKDAVGTADAILATVESEANARIPDEIRGKLRLLITKEVRAASRDQATFESMQRAITDLEELRARTEKDLHDAHRYVAVLLRGAGHGAY